MRKIILTLIFLQVSVHLFAQEHYIKNIDQEQNYLKLKKFLVDQKFNTTMFQQQFHQWFILKNKKEFAAVLRVDNQHVIQTMPLNYDSKNLSWISASKRYDYRDSYEYMNSSFGSKVAQDIIHGIGNGVIKNMTKRKYHYRYSAADNNRSSQTPSFLQF